MTSGSGSGWPDVIKVPTQKVEHDPLCRQQHWEGGDCFDCRLIGKVRADEREHTAFLHEALLRNQMADLRDKVKALHSWAWGWGKNGHMQLWINKDEVLALLDGSSE